MVFLGLKRGGKLKISTNQTNALRKGDSSKWREQMIEL
jgi:hypothetical protein